MEQNGITEFYQGIEHIHTYCIGKNEITVLWLYEV